MNESLTWNLTPEIDVKRSARRITLLKLLKLQKHLRLHSGDGVEVPPSQTVFGRVQTPACREHTNRQQQSFILACHRVTQSWCNMLFAMFVILTPVSAACD